MQPLKKLSVLQFIIDLLKPYPGYVSIFIVVGLFFATVNTLLPFVLKIIIDKIVDFQGDKLAAFNAIQWDILLYISMWVAFCSSMRFLDWAKLQLFPNLREKCMQKMFAYLGQHAFHYFQNNFAGSLINRIIDMQGSIIDILTIIDEIYVQLLVLGIACLTLLLVHPIFALILLLWVACFSAITFFFLQPIAQLSHRFAEARSEVVGNMVDSIANIVNVRLFARHQFENQVIQHSIADTVQKERAMQKKIIWMRIFWDLSIVLLLGLNLAVLGYMYSRNRVTVGDFSFVISLSISLLWGMWYLAEQCVSFSEQIGKCNQALSIMHAKHSIVDLPEAIPLVVNKGEIEFKQVNFHYGEGVRLFHNKTIKIHAGEKVGLVGFSGSGKSTFVNLILRLFEIQSGTISIDQQCINQVTQVSLRENIAFIPQDVSLFHRSLLENIRYGRLDASDEEVIAASKKAHCHEFISALTDGYATTVGERGIKLSGGQRQRIAIARALLKNAPILILDEATSALDSVTEKYIQEALAQLMQGKTTLVIAHRLSTLAEMNRILVFSQGKIIEDGRHDELIQQEGHYATMWRMQAGGFLPEYGS